ncbi:hypothetical protein [Sunxiuqinia indica]|uniref:hypothetical protein n=1 Tax=Sunxiuqinia indica TaxID=2692584 RepID=UPI001358F237|nr:hypothetical protein [Sunxiuqinia indica]
MRQPNNTANKLCKLSTSGFYWQTRYSQTDEPDNQGRWARLCFYRQFLIARISRVQVKETVIFVATDYFPTDGNSNPCFVDTKEDFVKAKEGVEKRFNEFIKACY